MNAEQPNMDKKVVTKQPLLSCPFCGSQPRFSPAERMLLIYCPVCLVTVKSFYDSDLDLAAEHLELIWNRRTDELSDDQSCCT